MINEIFKSFDKNTSVEVTEKDDKIYLTSGYLTQEEIEEYMKSKLPEEHKDKHIHLYCIDWSMDTGTDIDFEFCLSNDKSKISKHIDSLAHTGFRINRKQV